MQSKATTVAAYLAELSADRRREVETVRQVVLKNLGDGYEEGMLYGMIGYYVPHSLYPAGYHCDPKQPLGFVGLASQKNYLSLYMMCMYSEGDDLSAFRKAWAKAGKKLNMGKSCIRFQRSDDLALDVIAAAIKRMPVKKWIAFYESSLKTMRERPTKGPPKGRRSAKGKQPAGKKSKAAR